MMFTTDGHPVWINNKLGIAEGVSQLSVNTQIQNYQGKKHLTFFSGPLGVGDYFIYDNVYEEVEKISTVDTATRGDLHEFVITEADTALVTLYPTIQFSQSSGDNI
jgi:hypothetical protein